MFRQSDEKRGPYASLTEHMTVCQRHDWFRQQGRDSWLEKAGKGGDVEVPSRFICAGADGPNKKLRSHIVKGKVYGNSEEWYKTGACQINEWTIDT
ncbi:hypothetical protein CCP3SC15_1960005 [Gammaproteobacteria bacterium]